MSVYLIEAEETRGIVLSKQRTTKVLISSAPLLFAYGKNRLFYLDPILIYISLRIDCLFEIRKIAVCFPWLSMPGDYRVTDEALLAETT